MKDILSVLQRINSMENPVVNISRVKLRKISVGNLAVVFSLFGVISGLISGVFLFIFIKLIIISIGMTSVPPMGGLVLLSFIALPIIVGILFWILGLILGLLFNLSLKITKGIGMSYEELD